MNDEICFVIMPFDSRLDRLYDLAIKPAVKSENLECIRADKISGAGNILADIVEHIHKAKVVIADLTGNNPNVFYELVQRLINSVLDFGNLGYSCAGISL